MKKLSKEELSQLKQVGGSSVVALLILAGVGLVVASVIMVASGSYVIGPSTTVVTTGGPGAPGAPGATVVVNNPGNNGADAFMGAMMGATVGTVIGEAIDGDQGGGGNIALALPQEKSKGGWIKHKNEYYHYEFTQTKCGKDVTLVRKFVK